MEDLAFVLICIVCGVAYWNSLENSFCFDDHLAIVNNGDVSLSTPWKNIWSNDIWGKNLLAVDSHRSFRPLLILNFRYLTYFFGMSPWHFRSFSIFIHGIVSNLVYILTMKLSRNYAVSLGAALLFAAHPVHVESVAAVVNMAEGLSALFSIAAYLVFAYTARKQRHVFVLLIALIVCWVFVWISILFKETGVVILGIIAVDTVVELLHVFTSSSCSIAESGIKWAQRYFIWAIFSILGVSSYVLFRLYLVGVDFQSFFSGLFSFNMRQVASSLSGAYLGESQLIRRAENPYAFLQSFEEKVLSYMYLHFRYFYLLWFPAEQSAEYSFDCIPKVMSWEDGRNVYSVAMYLSIALLSLLSLWIVARPYPDVLFKENSFFSIDRRAVLVMLIWLILPFIPMSGALLKLGTLLAERLLYVPSIGFCMLLSFGLNCMAMIVYKFSSKRPMISQGFFWILISAIVCMYMYRTHIYNRSWKDDETLFVHSLSVCPRSSKLNLQVAKIHVNRGEYLEATRYVDAAYSIDPEFCDIGYQKALLALFHDEDAESAMEIAAENLHCPFTSMQSLELLTKVMALETERKPKDASILAKHAALAQRGGLLTVAVKKYQAAVLLSFENNNYRDTLTYSAKAEAASISAVKEAGLGDWLQGRQDFAKKASSLESMLSWNSSSVPITDNSETSIAIRDQSCYVDLLGGTMRAHILDKVEKGKLKLPKSSLALLDRRKELLFRAMHSGCVLRDSTGRIVSKHAEAAVNYLSGILVPQMNKVQNSEASLGPIVEFGVYASSATETLMAIYNANKKLNAEPEAQEVTFQNALQLAKSAIQVWDTAGKSLFKSGEYQRAVFAFNMSLKYGTTDSTGIVGASCSTLYWKAHSLAALDQGFLRDQDKLAEIVQLLKDSKECDSQSHSSDHIMMAKVDSQLKSLVPYLSASL